MLSRYEVKHTAQLMNVSMHKAPGKDCWGFVGSCDAIATFVSWITDDSHFKVVEMGYVRYAYFTNKWVVIKVNR